MSRKNFAGLPLPLCCIALVGGAVMAGAAEVNAYLDMDITQLMNITVTSVSKREQSLSDAPAAVFVITQEDIHRSGVTTIADALSMAPGVQVAKISASKWSVSSRGFAGYASNKLLVMIDGRSVYSPANNRAYWDSQQTMLEDIDRIEIIRGPGGTLWGANAVNGVINIITKKAEETQGGLVRVGGGNQETFMAANRYGGKISDNTYGRLYLTYDNHGSNTLKVSGASANDDWQPAQGGFRMDGRPGADRDWTLQGDFYENKGSQIISPYWINTPPYQTAVYDKLNMRGGNLLGRWHQDLAAGNAWTFKAYYDNAQRDELNSKYRFDTVDLDLQYETRIGQRQNVTMGAGYRSIQADFDPTFLVSLPDRHDNLYSAFLQDEMHLLPDTLWLTLGSKYEHNEYSGDEWQPSAKLLWKPVERHSLWASVSRAVRTPTVVEQYGRITMGMEAMYNPQSPGAVGTFAFTGNPDFDSEILYVYEVGYRWQARNNLSFDLALFLNNYDAIHTAQLVPSRTGYEYKFVNAVDGNGYGFELAADWKATSWLSFNAAYSYLKLDLNSDEPGVSQSGGEIVQDASPRHQASLRSSVALAENWRFNLWLRYVDDISGRESASLFGAPVFIPSYWLLDANLTWTPRRELEVMLAGQNLASSGQFQYLSEYSTPATEIGRGVYGKITWHY